MVATKTKPAAVDKFELITNQICELLEKGVKPWSKPWKGGSNAPFQNLISGHKYSGSNPLWCAISNLYYGYDSPYYLTFLQAREQGWKIKEGAKSTWIKFAATGSKEIENDLGETVVENFAFAKWSNIFSTDCIDDSKGHKQIADFVRELADNRPDNPDKPIPSIDCFIANTQAQIEHGGSQAFYSPSKDKIKVPEFVNFSSAEKYYGCLLHELSHWTGSEKRLDREGIKSGSFGSEIYAFEELIAELSSAFVGNEIYPQYITDDLEHHAAYLDSWLRILKKDNKALFKAVGLARKSANYLLDFAR